MIHGHFQISDNDHQQIVEFVRDAAGKLTDRLDFLGLTKLFLRLFTVGQVKKNSQNRNIAFPMNALMGTTEPSFRSPSNS